jgi:predicted acetyltransferase
MGDGLLLLPPSLELLPGYAAALASGWSPNTVRDVSAEELASLRQDPAAFVENLQRQGGTIDLGDGRVVEKLPFRLFWIWDGAFCGAINLRFQRGREELPAHVSGHIGYAVVPCKRGRGYAKRALALLLPIARAEGLARVLASCDEDNLASRRVITANGGVLSGRAAGDGDGRCKLLFWIATGRQAPGAAADPETGAA